MPTLVRSLLVAALFWSCIAATAETLTEQELTGVWKMCYEPHLKGVSEPSSGFLVMMPNGQFYEIRNDCCRDVGESHDPSELGAYRLEETSVILESIDVNKKANDRHFVYLPASEVTLFDDTEGARVLPVLQIGGDLNYGFAKVYPDAE